MDLSGSTDTSASDTPWAKGPRATRKISSQRDLIDFAQSSAFASFMNFLLDLNQAVKGKPIVAKSASDLADNVQWAIKLIERLDELITENPPLEARGRFGNPAFKSWLHAVRLIAPVEMAKVMPTDYVLEVSDYFLGSFGDFFRIDYGTGHEAAFATWMYCLRELGVFGEADREDMVLQLFAAYTRLMRRLQQTYWLEPAGSHGVWGLDDYHFLPFLWGASQLIDHPVIKPKSIHDPEILEDFSQPYMYLACIHSILQVKTAALAWNSPMLNDISAVKTWAKVNEGLVRMYRVEVMGKLPIMQHFLFGRLLAFEPSGAPCTQGEKEKVTPMHIHSMRGDCCGNPIPSVYAAAQDDKATNQRNLRNLPYD